MKQENKKNKTKPAPVQIARAAIQLASFLLIPGLFITFFSSFSNVYRAVVAGTFTLSTGIADILIIVALLLVTLLWGRFFCGFLCSFGAMQDLLHLIGKRLPFRPVIYEKTDRALKYLKFAVLAFVVLGVWTFAVPGDAVWSPWTVFGMYASPWKGLPTQAVFLSAGGALLLLIMIGSLFVERFFCKYLCPLGAIFSLASRFRLFRIERKNGTCGGNCRVCTRKCSMSVPLYRYERVSSGECINCMKCVSACPRKNITAQAVPAVSGTLAAAALAGVTFSGVLPEVGKALFPGVSDVLAASDGRFTDGVYTGSAQGFRSEITVRVTVEDGAISDIAVTAFGDDANYVQKATDGVIPAILNAQDTNVDTVSGATFSSRGIINAVKNALNGQLSDENGEETETAETHSTRKDRLKPTQPSETEAPETEAPATEAPRTETQTEAEEEPQSERGGYADGVYTGYGTGFRGTTSVTVTVENGRITDITVNSYQDDGKYFSKAKSGVIAAILSNQSVSVSTVSGATFSSNSIIEAVADALELEFTNPNASSGGKTRR